MSSIFSAATSFFGMAPKPEPPATPASTYQVFLDRNPDLNQRGLQPNEGTRLDEFMNPEAYEFVITKLKESHPDFEFADTKIVQDRETKRSTLPAQIVKMRATLFSMERENFTATSPSLRSTR